jgi:HSP20 family protein
MTRPAKPFDELDRLFKQMQANFQEASRWWNAETFGSEAQRSAAASVDLENRAEELVLTADLPGFSKEDIDVRVTDRTLRLEAEHEETSEGDETCEYVRRERRRTSIARSVPLPEAVDVDEISARYTDGVLTVRMPKSEPLAEGTEVEIQ